MSNEDHIYHQERAQKCREMAKLASDPDVRRRHEELGSMHAGRAAQFTDAANAADGQTAH